MCITLTQAGLRIAQHFLSSFHSWFSSSPGGSCHHNIWAPHDHQRPVNTLYVSWPRIWYALSVWAVGIENDVLAKTESNNSLDAMNEWQIQLAFGYFVFIRILSNAGRANRALLLLARALQHSWGPEPETRAGTLSYTPRINSFYGKINTITIDRVSPAPSVQLYQPEHVLYD